MFSISGFNVSIVFILSLAFQHFFWIVNSILNEKVVYKTLAHVKRQQNIEF